MDNQIIKSETDKQYIIPEMDNQYITSEIDKQYITSEIDKSNNITHKMDKQNNITHEMDKQDIIYEIDKKNVTHEMIKHNIKQRRKCLTLRTKIDVIRCSEAGVSHRQVAKKFSCGKTQVSSILKNKETLLKEWELNRGRDTKRRRKGPYENVNKLVWEWFQDAKEKNLPLSGTILQEKAREYAEALSVYFFTASNGWLNSFKKRYNINFRKINDEIQMEVDSFKVDEEEFESIPFLTERYPPESIYHIGKTCLFFKAFPEASTKKENNDLDKELVTDCVTVVLCYNSDGLKETPLIITKFLNAACLQDIDLSMSGIIHKTEEKATLSAAILSKYLEDLNLKMSLVNQNIVLLFDNNLPIPSNLSLSHIKLEPFPSNVTSNLEYDVKDIFKMLYRKNVLKMFITQLDNTINIPTLSKCLTTLDVMQFVKNAWDEVNSEGIRQCFKAWGVNNQYEYMDNSYDYNEDLQELKELSKGLESYSNEVFKIDKNSQIKVFKNNLKKQPKQESDDQKVALFKAFQDENGKDETDSAKTPFTLSEALHAIAKMKETFKILEMPNCIDKLDDLQSHLEMCIINRGIVQTE